MFIKCTQLYEDLLVTYFRQVTPFVVSHNLSWYSVIALSKRFDLLLLFLPIQLART